MMMSLLRLSFLEMQIPSFSNCAELILSKPKRMFATKGDKWSPFLFHTLIPMIHSIMAILEGYPYVEAKWHSSRRGNKPTIVVIHYTAGRGDAKRLANYFQIGKRKASAHFGIGRPGEVYQMVDTDHTAWHAGGSKFRDFRIPVGWTSIGIEICNTGFAYIKDDQPAYPGRHRNPASRPKRWECYTWYQQQSLEKLIFELKKIHPTLKYVCGHEDIRNSDVIKGIKGSKSDPGPGFFWKSTNWSGLEQWHWSFRDKEFYHCPQGTGPTH